MSHLLSHLHTYTAVYKVLFPLATLASCAALVFACLWKNDYAWALLAGSILLLVLVVSQWVVLMWTVYSIHYASQHGFVGSYSSEKVRLYDCVVQQGSLKVLEIIYSVDEKTGEFITSPNVQQCVVEALRPAFIQMRWGLWIFHAIVSSVVRTEDVQRLYDSLPQYYKDELKEFTQAMRSHMPSSSFLSRWTEMDWFMIQLIPDMELFLSAVNPCSSWLKRTLQTGNDRRVRVSGGTGLGCTALMTPKGFYRNMDWPSLGMMGTFTLLIRRCYPNGCTTLEVGVPGLLGTVTAVIDWENKQNSDQQLQNFGMLAMNVCCPHENAGWMQAEKPYLPASYVNRIILHGLATHGPTALYEHNLAKFLAEADPIGPYHISFGRFDDAQLSGVMIHCCQDGNGGHVFRQFPGNTDGNDAYLLTCNGNFTERTEKHAQASCFKVYAHDLMHTNARTDLISKQIGEGCTDGKELLSTFPVNNHETCYFVALEQHSVELRVNNAFAAAAPAIDITNIVSGQ